MPEDTSSGDDILKPEVIPSTSRDEQSSSQMSLSIRSGPIPPDELQEYEKLVPGFAKEYLTEALEQSRHRREIERESLKFEEKVFTKNHQRSLWGSIAGTVIILAALSSATILGLKGREKEVIAVTASLAAVAGIVYGSDAYNRSRNQKKELDTEIPQEKAQP
jgi:uncharacterized membrane protein